jgi:hypothetical protein
MQDYSFTKHRIIQWMGILLALGLIAVSYWYFSAKAGVKTNTTLTDSLSEGLAGYWKFDDGTSGATPTTATDSSTNGNTGTLTGSPTWTTGQIGSAVDFDGTDDYITMGDNDLYGPSADFTIAAWINQDAITTLQCIFCKDTRQVSGEQFRFSVGESVNGKLRYSAATEEVGGNTLLTAGTWYHAVITRSSSSGRLNIYLNGVNDGSAATGSVPSAPTSNVKIGSRDNASASEYWNGKIDEVRFYNRALSADEVSQLYRLNAPTGTDTSLKGYWSFNGKDISGTTAYDRSGAGNNGTLTGGPTVTTGKVGQALSFDGSDDYVTIPNATSLNSTAQVTVSAWIKRSGIGTRQFFVSKGNATTVASTQYWLELTAGNVLVFELASGSTEHKLTSSFVLTDTQGWHHVVGTYDGTTQKIFLDGVQDTTTSTWSGALNSVNNDLVIGNRSAGYDIPFNGKVDEVRVYNTALTAAEIQSLYKRGESDTMNVADINGNLNSGLAGYWKLDEGSGTSAVDSSINGSTGTLTGGPTWTTGQVGGAVDFDGTDDYINLGSPAALDIRGSITMSAWVKTDVLNTTQAIFSVGTRACCGTENYLHINWNAGGGTYRFIFASFGVASVSSSSNLSSGVWYHVVGTWDGATRKIFINGVLDGSTAQTSQPTDYLNAVIIGGGEAGNGPYFNGSIDETRIYNRALSDNEVAQLYRYTGPAAADSGLVGYWSFNGTDTTSTKAYDRSGAGNTGTLTGGPSVIPGKVGQALSFSGSNQYGVLGASNTYVPTSSSPFSLSIWFKANAIGSSDNNNRMLSLRNGGSSAIILGLGLSNKVQFYNNGTGTHTTVATVNTGQWYHYVLTYSGTQFQPYINGVAQGSPITATGPTVGSQAVTVATFAGEDFFYNGSLDEIRIYTAALTAAQIQALYKAGESDVMNVADINGNLNSGLAGYWAMNEGTGTSAKDSSINGNTGTLTGGPTWTTGQVGGAVSFDGVNDYIATPYSAAQTSTSTISYSFWAAPDLNEGGGILGMLNGEDASSTNYISIDNAGSELNNPTIGVIMTIGGTADSRTVNFPLVTNAWFHFVYTYDGSYVNLYVNGALLSSSAKTGALHVNTENGIQIGRVNGLSDGDYKGLVDEVRIYTRALSATEVAQLYRYTGPAAADSGLVGHWSFNGTDTTSTKAYDRSGTGNTGTLTNGPTVTPGKLGQALSFDGSNDFVGVGDIGVIDGVANATLSGWIKRGATNAHITFGKHDTSSGRFAINFYNDGNVYFNVGDGSGTPYAYFVSNDTDWHHVVMAYDGSQSGNANRLKVYFDGVQQTLTFSGTIPATTYASSIDEFRIGRNASNGFYSNGFIDEVRLYTRTLSTSEIVALYNASR